jgi:hypothetical protein
MFNKEGERAMTTVKCAVLLFSCGAALLAQQENVIFTTGAAPGLPGMPPGAVGANTFAFVSGELVGGNPVKGAPYSGNAVTETTQVLADGNRIANTITAAVYRDGEGRERREQSLPNIGTFTPQGAPPTTVFISDPVAGVNYSLNPNEKTAIKLPVPQVGAFAPMPPGAKTKVRIGVGAVTAGVSMIPPPLGPQQVMIYKASAAGPAPNPATEEQLGTKVVEGVQAEGVRTTMTVPAGQIGNDKPIQIVDEVWRSPELQVLVHSEHSDPRMGSTVYSLQNISRSDPSPTLFQVPADYTIKDSPALQKALAPAQ